LAYRSPHTTAFFEAPPAELCLPPGAEGEDGEAGGNDGDGSDGLRNVYDNCGSTEDAPDELAAEPLLYEATVASVLSVDDETDSVEMSLQNNWLTVNVALPGERGERRSFLPSASLWSSPPHCWLLTLSSEARRRSSPVLDVTLLPGERPDRERDDAED
jgi:hypothetical protein